MLFITFVALLGAVSNAYLVPRTSTPQCFGLSAESNNGDRKIAIVIDASYSMLSSDPLDLRLAAGKSVLDWLITQGEATSDKKQDAVTVIEFSDDATLDYALGDPANAYGAVANISITGGTYIASGVEMAIAQLTADGTGATADRSGIVVFTDGEDSSVRLLVDQINNAAKVGIRVSFGFLSTSSGLSYQDKSVLSAIMNSGGRYFTISAAQSSNNFINGIIVNGLTKNDNPNGDTSVLLAGLDSSHYISGSETQTMTYYARKKEKLTFTVQSLDAGNLDVQVKSGASVLASGHTSFSGSTLNIVSPGDGNIDVRVTAKNVGKNSIFVVGVESDLPTQNCTVGIGKGGPGGGSNVAKTAGLAGGSVGGLAILLVASYFIWKYCYPKHPKPPTGAEMATPGVPPAAPPLSKNWFSSLNHVTPAMPPPPSYHTAPNNMPHNPDHPDYPDHNDDSVDYESGSEYDDVPEGDDDEKPLGENPSQSQDPTQNPQNPPSHAHNRRPHRRMKRVRIYGNNHHHHIAPDHPCYNAKCPITAPSHVCDDPNHPCTCVDPKCKLNSRVHMCSDNNAPLHRCPGPKRSTNCPLQDPPYAEAKEKEHAELVRKYMAEDFAKSGVKTAASYGIRTLAL
ncbi:uncharacterized protein BDR25DRAFT_53422 [Lindgomyces ingoldianus]|uniref:Uncharacterized protein n=1 Tax=Lindgomyces ingoldianus TaxID=673940 RepID=A0ACB6QRX8_9PLEO|nr:uncharacterized protein BDR25DRAFT_53422 [Lindgomyces ingoldianus]KAF2468832.1 hypothetical protein BDR25DRAFT_53422 [Lindgomyces ingoldianus]